MNFIVEDMQSFKAVESPTFLQITVFFQKVFLVEGIQYPQPNTLP